MRPSATTITQFFYFQYVVAPNRRGTAEALQILVSHLFGDAGSPYLIGVVSEQLKTKYMKPDPYCNGLQNPDFSFSVGLANQTRCGAAIEFFSMQYAMGVTLMVVGIGAIFFFICALFVVKDKLALETFVSSKSSKRFALKFAD